MEFLTRKMINDPVHGFITINDPVIFELIAHPYYQRLRRIQQMALAQLVYPGAVHTRLHHSLGAYHLMCIAIAELKDKGIKVTGVYPGATYTNSWAGSGVEPSRIMESSDIAKMILAATQLSPQAVVEDIVMRPQLGDL